MYRPVKITGDAVEVPQLLFSRLSAPGGGDGRFRVALYLLGGAGAQPQDIAHDLRLPMADVKSALDYWEGAGLIEQDVQASAPTPEPARREVMTTRQVVEAGRENPQLAWLLEELQRLFGVPLGQGDINQFVTLYVQDKFDAELILLAAVIAKSEGAQRRGGYAQRVLFSWRQMDIRDSAAADHYLRLLAEREVREKALAAAMGLVWDPFTRADKKKIAVWHEEYGYDLEMVEAARLAAGDKRNSVAYLAGVLKKWHGKGYRTVRDVYQGDENRNIRVFRPGAAAAGDLLSDAVEYVPMKKRSAR